MQPEIELYDVVTILRADPENSVAQNSLGIVDAIRRLGVDDYWYAVLVCTSGVGFGCPKSRTIGFRSGEIRRTGTVYRPSFHRHRVWPFAVNPQFALYQNVMVTDCENPEWIGCVGSVMEPPECYDVDDWIYDVSVERDVGSLRVSDLLALRENQLSPAEGWHHLYWMEKTNPPQFAPTEKVIILDVAVDEPEIVGKLGVITSRTHEDTGEWSYGVMIYGMDELHYRETEQLLGTGDFDYSNLGLTDEHVIVHVDEETGYGEIVETYREGHADS